MVVSAEASEVAEVSRAVVSAVVARVADGDISIFSEGHSILSNNSQTFFGLRYTADNYSFVEPVLVGGVKQKKILSNDTPPEEFLGYINYDKPINSERNNDYGILKGLLVARGVMPAYYLGKKGLQVPQEKPQDILAVYSNFIQFVKQCLQLLFGYF